MESGKSYEKDDNPVIFVTAYVNQSADIAMKAIGNMGMKGTMYHRTYIQMNRDASHQKLDKIFV